MDVQVIQQKENIKKETTCYLEIRITFKVEKIRIQINYELELRRLMVKKSYFIIQNQQLGIIPILSYLYITVSNSYVLF